MSKMKLYQCDNCRYVMADVTVPTHCFMCDIIDKMNGVLHRHPMMEVKFNEIRLS